jgi:hypothetical protein
MIAPVPDYMAARAPDATVSGAVKLERAGARENGVACRPQGGVHGARSFDVRHPDILIDVCGSPHVNSEAGSIGLVRLKDIETK